MLWVTLDRSATAAETTTAPPAKPVAEAPAEAELDWYDVTQWGVEGRAWPDQQRQRWFDRFPRSAEGKVTGAVWNLSRDGGMLVRFQTDATAIWADYVLRSDHLAMPHMPATGVSGVDLYARDERGHWRWVDVTRPDGKQVASDSSGADASSGEYGLYLPLYNGVESLKIGVSHGAALHRVSRRGCQAGRLLRDFDYPRGVCLRPGMVPTAILGRTP